MTTPYRTFVVYFLAFFFLIMGSTVFVDTHRTDKSGAYYLALSQTADDIPANFGGMDASSYVRGAQSLLHGGDLQAEYYLNMWTPGLFLLEAFIIYLVPGHFVFMLFASVCLLWSISLGLMATLLTFISRKKLLGLSTLAVPALPIFHTYLFFWGIIMSETFSIALFVMAIAFGCISLITRSYALSILTAVVLAAATLFRAQFMLATFGCLGLTMAGLIMHRYVYKRHDLPFARMTALMLVLYALCIGGYSAWNHGGLLHMEYTYHEPWRIPSDPPDFVDQGGAGVLCEADPKTCRHIKALKDPKPEVNKAAILHVISHHPVEVVWLKTGYLLRYFFEETSSFPYILKQSDYIENSFLFIASLGSMLACAINIRKPNFAYLLMFQAGFWAGSLAVIYAFMHLEVRYVYPGKIVGLFCGLLTVALLYRECTALKVPA